MNSINKQIKSTRITPWTLLFLINISLGIISTLSGLKIIYELISKPPRSIHYVEVDPDPCLFLTDNMCIRYYEIRNLSPIMWYIILFAIGLGLTVFPTFFLSETFLSHKKIKQKRRNYMDFRPTTTLDSLLSLPHQLFNRKLNNQFGVPRSKKRWQILYFVYLIIGLVILLIGIQIFLFHIEYEQAKDIVLARMKGNFIEDTHLLQIVLERGSTAFTFGGSLIALPHLVYIFTRNFYHYEPIDSHQKHWRRLFFIYLVLGGALVIDGFINWHLGDVSGLIFEIPIAICIIILLPHFLQLTIQIYRVPNMRKTLQKRWNRIFKFYFILSMLFFGFSIIDKYIFFIATSGNLVLLLYIAHYTTYEEIHE